MKSGVYFVSAFGGALSNMDELHQHAMCRLVAHSSVYLHHPLLLFSRRYRYCMYGCATLFFVARVLVLVARVLVLVVYAMGYVDEA
jgi:hypothetical protein